MCFMLKKQLKHTKPKCKNHGLELTLSKSAEFIDKSEVKMVLSGSVAIFTVRGGKQLRASCYGTSKIKTNPVTA